MYISVVRNVGIRFVRPETRSIVLYAIIKVLCWLMYFRLFVIQIHIRT